MLTIPNEIKDYISYCPLSGALTWVKDKGKAKAGTQLPARASTKGYVRFRFNGKMFLGHRVAWFLYYNEQPPAKIDHDNRNRADNRIKNLRTASASLNGQNVEALGYYWHNNWQCFQSQYIKDGRKVHLGSFECPLLARLAYVDAKANENVTLPLLPSNGFIQGRQGDFVRKQGRRRPSGLGYTWSQKGFQAYANGAIVGTTQCPLLARILRVEKVKEQQGIELPFIPDCPIKGRPFPLKKREHKGGNNSIKSSAKSALGYSWMSGTFAVYVRSEIVGREYCPLLARMLRVDKLKELENIEVPLLPTRSIKGRKDFRPLPSAK